MIIHQVKYIVAAIHCQSQHDDHSKRNYIIVIIVQQMIIW